MTANRAVYLHILKTYGKNPWQWVGFAAEAIRTTLLRIGTPLIMAKIAIELTSGDIKEAKFYVLIFLILHIIGGIVGTAGELVSIRAENKEYGKLIMSFYKKMTSKDMEFYRNNQTGYLASLFRQYLDSGMGLVRFLRNEVTRNLLSMTVPVAILLVVNWQIGLTALLIIIIQLAYILWSSSKANAFRERSHEIYRRLTGEVSDVITNIVAFKSTGANKEASKKISDLAKEEVEIFWLRRKTLAFLDFPRGLSTGIGVAAAFYVLLSNVATSPEAIGLLVLTMTYMFQIMRNVSELPSMIIKNDDLVTELYPALAYFENIHEAIRDPINPAPLTILNGSIEIDNVNFGYRGQGKNSKSISVFKGLNLSIVGGERLGIVGLSGAGKSTLASLIMRFDEVNTGSINIDGINIKNVKQADLHQKIAYVPQEPLLFHRTIRENIAYFEEQISDKDIIVAAKAAHAHEFIEELPQRYNTIVGERGIKLSGGQKQRIAIARAILKNAPIMIFDEATSALDSESEQIIQKALPEIISKQTAIVIAHRLSTVAKLDRIIVINKGRIIEEGTHEELLEQRGEYFSLWEKQTKNKD